jgi:RND family efflux transporter MFP subunit
MNRKMRVLSFALLPLLLVACGHGDKGESSRVPIAVQTAIVAAADEPGTVEAAGSLRSGRETILAGKVMGTVISIRKAAGDPVRKGEVLIVIDSRDVEGQIVQAKGALAQAQAAAAIAQANLLRYEQLFTRNAASQLELDQARYQAETAKGAVTQAEGAVSTASSYRSYAEIAAPFDGRVVDRLCEVGDMTAPGRPLMKIEDVRNLRLDVYLSEGDLDAAVPGQTVQVRIPSLGDQAVEGKVVEVVPALDPATRSFLVKIDVSEAPGLRSGLYGRATFQSGTRRVLRVPRTSLRHRGGFSGVFVAEDGRASFRLVTIADGDAERVEVLSGLSDGDRVVLDPPVSLEVGASIEVTG